MKPIRVLVVDDSSLVRRILREGLSEDPGIEVVGEARDAYEARDLVVQLRPDVMTLDVEMPRMDGVSFLKKLMKHHPMPVIMVSTLTQERAPVSLQALQAGAVDVVGKPTRNVGQGLKATMEQLRAKVRSAAQARVRAPRAAVPARSERGAGAWKRQVLAIGASTGGTEALTEVLSGLPADTPPTLVVQHMPAAFTGAFAQRLNQSCAMEVVEADHGMPLKKGQVLLAPGHAHMRLLRRGPGFAVSVSPGPPVSGHCPSVDVMMQTVARYAGDVAVGAILTGMGADGADGLLAMRRSGARTVAQDEGTSVVYGMPRVATLNGGAELVRPLGRIAPTLVELLRTPADGKAA